MSKAQIIGKSIGIGVTAVLLIGAVVLGVVNTPAALPCVSLRYTIEDRSKRLYLTERELDDLLRAEDIYPVGRAMNNVSLHQMELAIRRHPMVRTADCYMTPRSEVRIRLTQREPLLRVQTPHEHYLVDTDRRVMQARASVTDSVPVMTGNIGPQMATTQLANFAEWLQSNSYWRERIHHVYVQSPYMTYIYLKGERLAVSGERMRVVLGRVSGYEKKLAKLRTFLNHGREETADKQYRELDLRFKGQVIGRR